MVEPKDRRYTLGPSKKMQERRAKVLRLRYIRKWPEEQIAQALGISKATVERDIKALHEYGLDRGLALIQKPVEQAIFEIQAAYEERQRERWNEYTKAGETETETVTTGKKKSEVVIIPKNPVLRRRILNDIANEDEFFIKAMQSLGVLPKSPEQLELSGRDGKPIEYKPDLSKLNDEELAALEYIISKSKPADAGGHTG
jgi:hypothetical protein